MARYLTDKRVEKIRQDISYLFTIPIQRVQISTNDRWGFYLKIDVSEKKSMSAIKVFRMVQHYIAEINNYKPVSLIIKTN